MNPNSSERASELASNLLMVAVSLTLVAGYLCLFHVFRSDRQEILPVAHEQETAAPETDMLSRYQAPE